MPPELTEFLMNKLKTVDWQPDKEVSLWNEAKRALRLNVGRMMVRRELARLRGELRLPIMDNCSIVNPLDHTTGKVCKKVF